MIYQNSRANMWANLPHTASTLSDCSVGKESAATNSPVAKEASEWPLQLPTVGQLREQADGDEQVPKNGLTVEWSAEMIQWDLPAV